MRQGESGESLSRVKGAEKTKTYGGMYVKRTKQKKSSNGNEGALADPVCFGGAIDDGGDKYVCGGRAAPFGLQVHPLRADQPRFRSTRCRDVARHEPGERLGGVFHPDQPLLGQRQ